MSIAKIIGERIRAYRNQKGWSQEYLAEKADVHHTYIGQLERGEKNATIESISKIAGALGVSLSRLFENISIEQQADNLPAQCYALLQEQPVNDQKALAEILAALIRKRQTTPRMDRHETIVTGRCETFRYCHIWR